MVPRFEKWRNHQGQWWWRFRGSNGEILFGSTGEGYHNQADCDHAISLAQTQTQGAPIHTLKEEPQ